MRKEERWYLQRPGGRAGTARRAGGPPCGRQSAFCPPATAWPRGLHTPPSTTDRPPPAPSTPPAPACRCSPERPRCSPPFQLLPSSLHLTCDPRSNSRAQSFDHPTRVKATVLEAPKRHWLVTSWPSIFCALAAGVSFAVYTLAIPGVKVRTHPLNINGTISTDAMIPLEAPSVGVHLVTGNVQLRRWAF